MADKDQQSNEDLAAAWAAALEESDGGDQAQAGQANYAQAPLDELTDDGVRVADDNMDMEMILDIPVTISMEIGRTHISIRNLLKLNQGSVIELDRLAGEPLDVLVNGTLIAHGEVVVVNEKFGIRLTDVITAMERVKKLK